MISREVHLIHKELPNLTNNSLELIEIQLENLYLKIMNTEQLRQYATKEQELSTEFTNESLMDSERLKWKTYLNHSMSNSDLIRLSLTEYVHNLVQDQNRSIFHLTTTYKPYQERTYNQKDIDQFFTNFYVKYLLPEVLGTKNIHTVTKKSIQPITFTFTDEHLQSFHSDRLHHHSILCVHPKTLDFFQSLPEENPFPSNLEHTKKICTSHIRECDPMTLLYSSKMLDRYHDFLTFPDKFHREHH